MKNFAKSKGKRITAALLCAVMCIMSLPLSAFAFTAEEGKTVDAYYGDKYVSADGEMYYSPSTYQYIAYDANGNESLHTQSAGNSRTKLMIKDSSGSRQIMCIESGIPYNAGGTYDSKSGTNSSYFQNLPTTAQYGIMLTSVYGWRPGKTAPISGTNEDDFSMATQIILWEYQQQLRTSPTTLKANSYGVPADTYFKGIKGRPAEKCYNWLLSQMQNHATIPSFASNKSSSATTYTLKYNQAADNYSLTLTDTNNTLSDIKFSASGITVSRSGNKYTFTSKKMIETAVSVTAQKNVPGIDGNFLVWGYPGKQTMMSGAEDPVVFYLKIKTETTGVGHIVKHSEDGKVANIKFNIAGNGVNQTVTTKADGTVDIELMPGVYTVTELTEEKYEPQNVQRVTIVSGNTSTVTFSNTLKRGDLQVIKSSEDNLVEGVTFHLYGTSLSGISVDEYAVTDKNGVATFKDVLISGTMPCLTEIALAIELFTHGSLNTFAKPTNVDTDNRLICYDILDLGKQLMPIGMLVVLDSILNRITQNRAKGKNTYIFIDEIYLLFQHEYSANFLFTLWKRVRKYGAYATGITQNVDDLLQSHTARTMLANSEFIIMLNQASTDRLKLAELLNISDLQMSYITNVEAGHGLLKVGSSLVPFANKFPKNTKLYKLMTTKPGESA